MDVPRSAHLDTKKRIRRKIESALAFHLRDQSKPISGILPDDVRYYRRKTDETPVYVEIKIMKQVLRLPDMIEAKPST